jgi:hypothetical protein
MYFYHKWSHMAAFEIMRTILHAHLTQSDIMSAHFAFVLCAA